MLDEVPLDQLRTQYGGRSGEGQLPKTVLEDNLQDADVAGEDLIHRIGQGVTQGLRDFGAATKYHKSVHVSRRKLNRSLSRSCGKQAFEFRIRRVDIFRHVHLAPRQAEWPPPLRSKTQRANLREGLITIA